MLLLYFFTGIGLNARLDDLISGGRPLLVLLAMTLVYLVIQNAIAAVSVVAARPAQGHHRFRRLGLADRRPRHDNRLGADHHPAIRPRQCARSRHRDRDARPRRRQPRRRPDRRLSHRALSSQRPARADPVVGLPEDPSDQADDDLSHVDLLRTVLVLNVVILIAYDWRRLVEETGIKLPLFVVCLLVGIVVTNVVPRLAARRSPGRRAAGPGARSRISRSTSSWRCR